MELTKWFRGTEKPVRRGVYQQMCGLGKLLGYQYWDGKKWHVWAGTPESAYQYRNGAVARTQDDKWRGLKTPNACDNRTPRSGD